MKAISSDVLVFKTNIFMTQDIERVSGIMNSDPRIIRWNIDRDDVDNVLRIEAEHIRPIEVKIIINAAGYYCEELPD